MNLPALVRSSQQDVYTSLTILGCRVNCRFQFADCPLIHCVLAGYKNLSSIGVTNLSGSFFLFHFFFISFGESNAHLNSIWY